MNFESGDMHTTKWTALLVSCCLPPPLQVRGLVEAADPLALTEHGQFYRQPEACKVGGLPAAHLSFARPPACGSCSTFLSQRCNHSVVPFLAQFR